MFETSYDFKPDSYGPFDVKIFDDAKKLSEQKLFRNVRDELLNVHVDECLATPEGLKKSRELSRLIDGIDVDYIARVGEWVLSLSWLAFVLLSSKHIQRWALI